MILNEKLENKRYINKNEDELSNKISELVFSYHSDEMVSDRDLDCKTEDQLDDLLNSNSNCNSKSIKSNVLRNKSNQINKKYLNEENENNSDKVILDEDFRDNYLENSCIGEDLGDDYKFSFGKNNGFSNKLRSNLSPNSK